VYKKEREKIIKEWEEEEWDVVRKNLPNFTDTFISGFGDMIQEPISSFESFLKTVFPEFDFKEPLGVWDPSIGNLTSLLPFYRQIIVPLGISAKAEKLLGLSLPQLIELYKHGFVLPILLELPSPSSAVFNLYKPLLELRAHYHIPSRLRSVAVYTWLFSRNLDESMKKARVQITKRYGPSKEIESKVRQSPYRGCAKKLSGFPKTRLDRCIISEFEATVALVKFIGFDKIIESVFKIEDIVVSYILLDAFISFFIEPLWVSFGGNMNYGYKRYRYFLILGELLTTALIESCLSEEKSIILPQNFLIELKDRILYNAPWRINDPVGFAYKLREYDCVEEHFQILKQFNDDFIKGKFTDAFGTIKKEKEVMNEVNARVKEIERSSKQIKNIIKIGSVLIPSSISLPLGIQTLTQGDIASFFTWVGICAANVLMGKYDEELSRLLAGLKFKRIGTPYLLWQHEKKR